MGLRCLVGHDYGEARTARDQQERGNEVVVTVREYRECARCGHQRVISENKEVKVGTPAEPGAEEPAEPGRPSGDEPAADASTAGRGPGGADPRVAPGGFADPVEPMTAEEDDGIILEDEPEGATRAHGEWPDDGLGAAEDGPADAEDGPADEATAGVAFGGGPAAEGPDEAADEGSADDEASDGDADIIDAEARAASSTGAGGGSGTAADEPASAGGDPRPRPDDGDTEFVCPECGETWPAVNASLRAGDICPECRRGYLAEQVAQ